MKQNTTPWSYLLLLILAGESVFMIPFVLPRIFRPTVLEAFQLDNTQLGFCYSVYGIVALFSYLLGGAFSDKFAPRKLMAISLIMTALGGLVYATFPSYTMLKIIYGYWGFTTIFLFWSPMMKAARIWGGKNSQGKAFGLLDGGRGLVGVSLGTVGLFVFSLFITSDVSGASPDESRAAFRQVVLILSGVIVIVGLLVWFFMKIDEKTEKEINIDKIKISQVKEVLRLPSVWMLMFIVLCAYIGYKITDIFSLYAKEIMMYDQLEAAKVGTSLLFIRPLVGVVIGLLADRSQITFWLFVSFVISFISALLFATGFVTSSEPILFFISISVVSTGVYAARSLYFAVMHKGQIPLILTGTAVGVISIVGYTPDIFFGPIMGYLLDNSPGITGYQNLFWLLVVFSFVGTVVSWYYYRLYETKK